MNDTALFQPRGNSEFEPTTAAVGPWDRRIVHGAAVAALFAGQLAPPERTLGRLSIELLSPVPFGRLTLESSETSGGKRVQRQHAVLRHDGRTVASAEAVLVRREPVELPERARRHASPFDPGAVPALDTPNRVAEQAVGWPSFDSRGVIVERLRVEGDKRPHQWIGLAVPVVAGTEISGIEVAAVAADYASTAVSWQLPYADWSFRNPELTMHFARPPVGSWIGMRCDAVLGSDGAGFNTAELFDRDGRVGRSAAALVVEPRDTN